jgi:hypothetical protein
MIAIGFFISWVPFVNYVGAIIELVGALLVILGRKAFGRIHARNVIWSIIIWVIGILAAVVGVFVAIFLAVANIDSGPSTGLFLGGPFVIGLVIGVAVINVSYVLLIYELVQKNRRILLLVGYVANVPAVLLFFLGGVLFLWSVVSIVPGILFGLAYYMARQRIVRGEIPGPAQPMQ